ncbi:hypothetical protein F4779DRAFT_165936 [Xylariaceae sp. FL0662B]|nr:hypothetical protein F4779DRAFT_165936 [Xylariaceae sp. FL0662B]
MPMLKRPWQKYEPFIGPDLPNRTWPSKTIKKAPRWLATDLRDGNQSLASPMTISQKWTYFKMLVELGYKEIEVSIPTASDIEYEFTRQLIETPGAVPDDVWLQVLCPCRLELIQRTVQSLRGVKKAIVSLYFAASPVWLDTVFGMSQQEVYDRVVEAVMFFKSITKDDPSQQGTTWNLMFSPEAFSGSDMSYCLQLCEAAKKIWAPTVENPIILNLPATVEMSTPNVYADQVEIFSTSISEREKVCVSLHVHNDRGCAIAAAELGLMAGAERIEGCLFGNGERSGNVDLVTLALNLYSQGIDPGVDFSDICSVRTVVEESTNIKVHPRSPYSGDLFFTAYSGAHQDAINKGLAKFWAGFNEGRELWKVPYLAMDPQDLGLSHDDIIRLNSQSGKGGVAWTLSHELHVELPKGLQLQFSKVVKAASETSGGIISSADVASLFLQQYFVSEPDPRILSAEVRQVNGSENHGYTSNGTNGEASGVLEYTANKSVDALINIKGRKQRLEGKGPDVISALTNALTATPIGSVKFHVSRCHVNPALGEMKTLVVVECQSGNSMQPGWGVRSSDSPDLSELLAALSSLLVHFLAPSLNI